MTARRSALKARHAALERALASELRRPRPDSAAVMKIKMAKLRVRDAIAQLDRPDLAPSGAVQKDHMNA